MMRDNKAGIRTFWKWGGGGGTSNFGMGGGGGGAKEVLSVFFFSELVNVTEGMFYNSLFPGQVRYFFEDFSDQHR